MLNVAEMEEIYELKGEGHGIREIARELDISRNTVRRYLRSPEAMRPKPRPPRGSILDPYAQHIDRRMAESLENGVVFLRELRSLGYEATLMIGYQFSASRFWGQANASAPLC